MKTILLLLSIIFLVGCNKSTVDEPKPSAIKKDLFEINTDEIYKKQVINSKEKITSYNEFISENYPSVFNEKIKKGSFVYSPYSYKMALEGLGTITKHFDGDDYLGFGVKENLEKNLDNLVTKNAVILNKKFLDTKSNKFILADFPKEAEKISEKLQKEILGEVLLNPDFKASDLTTVIINATKFSGKWEKEFEKDNTENRDFRNINGEIVKKETMWGSIDEKAIDNEEVSIGRKKLKEGGFVYFISPKNYDVNSLQKLSGKISSYIADFVDSDNDIKNDVNIYGLVELYAPKFNISSEIDLLDIEEKAGHKKINEKFDLVDEIVNKTGEKTFISKITQVANMMIDEEKVEAKAVTQMEAKNAAAPISKELIIKCDRPHFVVTTSGNGIINFIAFVGN